MMFTALYVAGQEMGGAFSPERLALAGQVTLIGMGMIFSVLALLWGVLAIFKLIFARPAKPEPKKATEQKTAEPEAVEAAPVAVEENDDQLIAVITAAVAAYIADEEPEMAQNGFRVVSFRRTNGGRSWNTK